MIEPSAENRTKRPTHCKVMPAESKTAHFSHLKKLHCYKLTEIQPTILYLHSTNWPQCNILFKDQTSQTYFVWFYEKKKNRNC